MIQVQVQIEALMSIAERQLRNGSADLAFVARILAQVLEKDQHIQTLVDILTKELKEEYIPDAGDGHPSIKIH